MNRVDFIVYYVGWCDDISVGFGVGYGLFDQGFYCVIVQNVVIFVDNVVLFVGGEWIQCDVGDDFYFGDGVFDCFYSILGQIIGVIGFVGVFGFFIG